MRQGQYTQGIKGKQSRHPNQIL